MFLRIKTIYLRLRAIYLSFRLLVDPENTPLIFELSEVLRELNSPLKELTLKALKNETHLWTQYKTGYMPQLTEESLTNAPHGSLGAQLREHLASNSLELQFYPEAGTDSFESYVVMRVRQVHDLWHVLLKFDTSVPGEAGLQAFTAAQMKSPFSILLVVLTGLHCLFIQPQLFSSWLAQVQRGFRLGDQMPFLLDRDLESLILQSSEESLRAYPKIHTAGKSLIRS